MTDMAGDWHIGQSVECRSSDSFFAGVIVSVFMKRDRKSRRVVIENDDGVCLIKREKDLWLPSPPGPAIKRNDPVDHSAVQEPKIK